MTELELLPFTHDFDESIQKYGNNAKVACNLRNAFPFPYTTNDARGYIQSLLDAGEERQCCRAIVVNSEAVGSVGFFLKDDIYCKSAEIGYWLGEPFWRQGIMSRAVKQMCVRAFEKYDVVRIFAEPFTHNAGSRGVLEKAGFTYEGTMKSGCFKGGEIFDYCMYGLVR